MRLLYHRTDSTGGLLILESDSQYRTIFSNSNASNVKRIPFPFVNFTIRYEISAHGFNWPGIYGGGLRVFGSKESLTTINDIAFLLPNETQRLGLVCTTHELDYSVYNSIIELVNTIVANWWGLDNDLVYHPVQGKFWHQTKPEELKNAIWKYSDSFLNLANDAINSADSYLMSESTKNSGTLNLTGEEVLINESWPPR